MTQTVRRFHGVPSGSVITAPKMAAAAFEARSFLDLVYALARGLGTFTFGDPRTATLKGIDERAAELYLRRMRAVPA